MAIQHSQCSRHHNGLTITLKNDIVAVISSHFKGRFLAYSRNSLSKISGTSSASLRNRDPIYVPISVA